MSPKTALLHIGTPKTGTTSIQNALARAERAGGLAPIRYPLPHGQNDHWLLALLYFPHRDLPRWMRVTHPHDDDRFRSAREGYRRFLFRELRSAPAAILSAEVLSLFPVNAVDRFRDDLESAGFGEFHVVVYIRDPADYYLSLRQQSLRSPGNLAAVADPAAFHYDFRGMVDRWEQVFPGRLLVRKYPSGSDVLDDFASLLKTHMGVSLARSPARLNASISAEGMHILHEYRQTFSPDDDGFLTPDTVRLVRFLQQRTTDIPQTKPALKSEVAEVIRANHAADAELIRSRYGVDLGLASGPAQTAHSAGRTHHIDEILEAVDPRIVNQLLLLLGRTELSRPSAKRTLPLRVAARAYRSAPRDRRPARLDSWLRTFAKGEP